MANTWFRLYAEFASDAKVQMLSESDQRRLLMLFCFRCNDDVTLQDEEVAFQLRISNKEWLETKAIFVSKGFINNDNEVLNWDKRQFVSDSSAARVAKHRLKNKELDKTACNVTVTPQNRTEQNRTDTEQSIKNNVVKKSNDFVLPEWINKNHWDVWHETPKRKKASDSQKMLAVNKLLAWKQSGIDYAQALENAAMGGYQGLFEPKNNKSQAPPNRTDFQQSTTEAAYEKLFGKRPVEKDISDETTRV